MVLWECGLKCPEIKIIEFVGWRRLLSLFPVDHVTDRERWSRFLPVTWAREHGKQEHKHGQLLRPEAVAYLTDYRSVSDRSGGDRAVIGGSSGAWSGGGEMRCLVTGSGLRRKTGQPTLWRNIFSFSGSNIFIIHELFQHINYYYTFCLFLVNRYVHIWFFFANINEKHKYFYNVDVQ